MYMRNHDNTRKAHEERDYDKLDNFVREKTCIDAHFMGKLTLPLYRSLFSFTGSMLILAGEE